MCEIQNLTHFLPPLSNRRYILKWGSLSMTNTKRHLILLFPLQCSKYARSCCVLCKYPSAHTCGSGPACVLFFIRRIAKKRAEGELQNRSRAHWDESINVRMQRCREQFHGQWLIHWYERRDNPGFICQKTGTPSCWTSSPGDSNDLTLSFHTCPTLSRQRVKHSAFSASSSDLFGSANPRNW